MCDFFERDIGLGLGEINSIGLLSVKQEVNLIADYSAPSITIHPSKILFLRATIKFIIRFY